MITYGLDLGSTRIKLGAMDEAGSLTVIKARNAPPVQGTQGKRVSDPLAWLSVADNLLKEVPPGSRLGISTQRSSFLLWDRDTGKPLTPLISWQDVRSESWYRTRTELRAGVYERTGLPLSAHYAAPKLAFLLENKALSPNALANAAFGTLETWLIWNWTDGRHVTALSVAARTCLLDLNATEWSSELCDWFGVSPALLPQIVNGDPDISLNNGLHLTAMIADQTAGALPLFTRYEGAAYVNGGTGSFVMRVGEGRAPRGYLTVQTGCLQRPLLWEGAVNAGAALFKEQCVDGSLWSTPLDCFSIGDAGGLGAPYWRSDLLELRSQAAAGLVAEDRQKVDMQAWMFRVRQLIWDLSGEIWPQRVIFSGGLAARSGLAAVLADVLPCPLWIALDSELGLWGACWSAAGRHIVPQPRLQRVIPVGAGGDLEARYAAWLAWLNHLAET